MQGGGDNDTLDGGEGDDVIFQSALAGNSPIDCGVGNDSIWAGAGDDRIVHDRWSGNDTINGGTGNDPIRLDGGGDDTFVFDANFGRTQSPV